MSFSFIFYPSEGHWELTCPAKYFEPMSVYLRHHKCDYLVMTNSIVIKNAPVTVTNELIKTTKMRGGVVVKPENPFE